MNKPIAPVKPVEFTTKCVSFRVGSDANIGDIIKKFEEDYPNSGLDPLRLFISDILSDSWERYVEISHPEHIKIFTTDYDKKLLKYKKDLKQYNKDKEEYEKQKNAEEIEQAKEILKKHGLTLKEI